MLIVVEGVVIVGDGSDFDDDCVDHGNAGLNLDCIHGKSCSHLRQLILFFDQYLNFTNSLTYDH